MNSTEAWCVYGTETYKELRSCRMKIRNAFLCQFCNFSCSLQRVWLDEGREGLMFYLLKPHNDVQCSSYNIFLNILYEPEYIHLYRCTLYTLLYLIKCQFTIITTKWYHLSAPVMVISFMVKEMVNGLQSLVLSLSNRGFQVNKR